jgi:hypothetical protein
LGITAANFGTRVTIANGGGGSTQITITGTGTGTIRLLGVAVANVTISDFLMA